MILVAPRRALLFSLALLIVAACESSADERNPDQGGSTATGDGAGGLGQGASGGQTTGGGGQGQGGQGGDSGDCFIPPPCDAAPPDPGPAEEWIDSLTPIIVTSLGSPRHRGRDLFVNPGAAQWVLAKFAYGLADKDLKGERVEIHLLRDCAAQWESLGTAITTQEGEHAAVEGVDDDGGRLFFEIPESARLGGGRHRLHLVVKGDLSTTELFIEVMGAGRPIFVSDVDGTLTTSETEEFTDLLTGALPDANPNAAAALQILATKGLRPFYLTARPEWLTERTREFLNARGFPPGVVFGNTDSDAAAYANANVQPLDHRIFFQFDDSHGGRRIEDYGELLGELGALSGCL